MPSAANVIPERSGRGERCVWYVLVVLLALFLTFVHLANNAPFRLTTFHQLVTLQAVEPFQHRILLPGLVAALQTLLPLGEKLLFGVFELIEWIALVLVAERALAFFGIGGNERFRRMLALTVLVPMYLHMLAPDLFLTPAFNVYDGRLGLGLYRAKPLFYYVYDLPAALFTLAMTLALARYVKHASPRMLWAWFALFVLATLNRETSALMIAFFALLLFRRMPWPRLIGLLALQCLIFVAIQWPLQWLFSGNVNPNAGLGGPGFENHLLLNLRILSEPAFALTFIARFGAGLWLPVLFWWRALDRVLAVALIGFGLPLIALALVGGIIREYRIFIEVVPLIWLAGLQVIAAPRPRLPAATGR